MDDETLNAIQSRADAATRGPWRVEDHEYNQGGVYYSVPASIAVGGPTDDPRDWREIAAVDRHAYDPVPPPEGFDQQLYEQMQPALDLQFIAHAREDVPALLAEVRRLRALLP